MKNRKEVNKNISSKKTQDEIEFSENKRKLRASEIMNHRKNYAINSRTKKAKKPSIVIREKKSEESKPQYSEVENTIVKELERLGITMKEFQKMDINELKKEVKELEATR